MTLDAIGCIVVSFDAIGCVLGVTLGPCGLAVVTSDIIGCEVVVTLEVGACVMTFDVCSCVLCAIAACWGDGFAPAVTRCAVAVVGKTIGDLTPADVEIAAVGTLVSEGTVVAGNLLVVENPP